MRRSRRPIGVDLFCGAGGMSLGFERAGIHVAAAVDADPIHAATHERNFPECRTLNRDLASLSGDELRELAGLRDTEIDVVFGGPPCQGFSFMGKRRSDDPRNALLLEFARLVDELSPSYFVLENVEGLNADGAVALLDAFVDAVASVGYSVVAPLCVLDASDFGVPQVRRRLFILGYRDGLPALSYPNVGAPGEGEPRPTVWDAIGDLSDLAASEHLLCGDTYHGPLGEPSDYAQRLRTDRGPGGRRQRACGSRAAGLTGCARTHHSAETVGRFAATAPGTHEPVSRFYRLPADGLSNTLRAGTDSSRGSYTAPRPIHPTEPRCITVREAARLHSFPDWFQFHATKWHGFRQVGNSVPPQMARAVASAAARQLRKDHRTEGCT